MKYSIGFTAFLLLVVACCSFVPFLAAAEPLPSYQYLSDAWAALEKDDLAGVIKAADGCIVQYSKNAKQMQSRLTGYPEGRKTLINNYWALNDVATAYFIKGQALRKAGDFPNAQKAYEELIANYRYGQCWDPRGWFWKPAEVAEAWIAIMKAGDTRDYGDLTSQDLLARAWKALEENDLEEVLAYTNKCLELYRAKALDMASGLSDYADTDKEHVFSFWALNDVATALFIKGEALHRSGEKIKAAQVYDDLVKRFQYGQCWDPRGWFWKPAAAAQDRLTGYRTGQEIDFGDYSSETLIRSAWQALNKEDYGLALIYTDKLITLYGAKAVEMQAGLSEYPSGNEKIFQYWALNDVATAYFIEGKAYQGLGQDQNALKAYQTLVNDYAYGQCWDPKGWWWKPASAAQDMIPDLTGR